MTDDGRREEMDTIEDLFQMMFEAQFAYPSERDVAEERKRASAALRNDVTRAQVAMTEVLDILRSIQERLPPDSMESEHVWCAMEGIMVARSKLDEAFAAEGEHDLRRADRRRAHGPPADVLDSRRRHHRELLSNRE